MANVTKNKKMIIKGAGKFMVKIPGCDELMTCGTLNNMRLDIQLDMQEIEGGDTSVPLDTLLRRKVIDITAEDAKFDLNMLRLVLGSKLKEGVTGSPYKMASETVTLVAGADPDELEAILTGHAPLTLPAPTMIVNGQVIDGKDFIVDGPHVTVDAATTGLTAGTKATIYYAYSTPLSEKDKDGYIWVLEEKHTVNNNKITLAFGTQLVDEEGDKTSHVSVRTLRGNKLLKKGVDYTVNGSTGEITFDPSLDKVDVYANYKRYEVVDVLDIATRDFPLTVTVVHNGEFEQKDGSIQGFQTELYACRVKSNFTLDAARQQAATHSVTLTVIDPERADGKLGTIKRYEVENKSMQDIC